MASLFSTEILLFAVTAALMTLQKKAGATAMTPGTCDAPKELRNAAFVFVKPHANTLATQKLVRETLLSKGIEILSEKDIDGVTIDEHKLIDQHYYAIASKATILPAKDIPVPADKFVQEFGEPWDQVLKEDRACNAMEACKRFNVNADGLDALWQTATKVAKFGGGFYCGLVSKDNLELYVFNAFFMSMRSKFVGKDCSIHCFEVQWSPTSLSWEDFRNVVLGPTDPAEGPPGSLRKTILERYQALGLKDEPNKGDNGVHASASPFEGLAERINWLGKSIEADSFGKALLDAGLPVSTIQEWSVDPRIPMPDGSIGSVFDALEDMNVDECLAKMVALNSLGDAI
jgi:hypothetical protein